MPTSRPDDADRQAAEGLLQAICRADDGYYTSSAFDRLLVVAHIARASSEADHFPYRHLVEVAEHFNHLITLVSKISWLADRRAAGELDDITWMYFCASDILTFYTVMRSLFDEVSAIAARVSKKKGVVPDKDFHRLREWTKKNVRSDEALGRLLAESIRGCDWFNELRDIRDDLVHRSARTIVFLERNRVLFQVHVGLSPRIFIPSVMFNANVVDFPSYSALLMARTATFLEQFARAPARSLIRLADQKADSCLCWSGRGCPDSCCGSCVTGVAVVAFRSLRGFRSASVAWRGRGAGAGAGKDHGGRRAAGRRCWGPGAGAGSR